MDSIEANQQQQEEIVVEEEVERKKFCVIKWVSFFIHVWTRYKYDENWDNIAYIHKHIPQTGLRKERER